MATLLKQIGDSPDIKVVRFKDRIKDPSGGWRDAMINFCVRKSDFPHHICEVQIVHQKMALCRRKDGLGGHDEYAQERNARELLEYLCEQADTEREQAERAKITRKIAKETEEGGCSFIFMDADFIRRLSRTEHDKWTEWTAGPKWSGKTFPRMQEMEKIFGEDAFKEHTISCREAFRGNYLKKGFCAVSHRWDESGKPDSTGIHLKKIREFLDQHQDIKWIWYDFWCLPQLELPVTELTIELTPTSDGSRWVLNSELEGKQQFIDFAFDGGVVVSDVDGAVASGDGGLQKGDLLLRFEGADMTTALPKPKEGEAPRAYEFVVRRTENGGKRTKREDLYFDHQLKHANLLYLGCKVLVLLDLSYQSRFWTQFELWLSVQEGTDEGLKPATEVHAKRVHLEPIHNATKELADSLLNIWRTKTPEEAHKLLEGTDVQVTNQRDKKHHLPKILSLDEDVRKSALEMRAEHEPSASNAEETKAAAAKTAGQQDSRSGPVIGGPGRRFAVLAAVFRWAMPRSRKVAVMEQYRSPKEQERHSSEFITRLLLRLWALRAKSRVGPTGSESQSVREVAEALSVKKEAAAAKTAGPYHATPSQVDCGTSGDARGASNASKYTVAPGEKEGEIIVKDLT